MNPAILTGSKIANDSSVCAFEDRTVGWRHLDITMSPIVVNWQTMPARQIDSGCGVLYERRLKFSLTAASKCEIGE